MCSYGLWFVCFHAWWMAAKVASAALSTLSMLPPDCARESVTRSKIFPTKESEKDKLCTDLTASIMRIQQPSCFSSGSHSKSRDLFCLADDLLVASSWWA